MKPMSLPLLVTRTPQCQSLSQPGGCSALHNKHTRASNNEVQRHLNIAEVPGDQLSAKTSQCASETVVQCP